MNEQMNVQIEQYAYIKEKNCVFIYLTFHCYDSKKKITIGSVRLPSVVVDDGLDAFAMIVGQDC